MKTFYIFSLFILGICSSIEPEGLKLTDIYKIRQQMQQYLKSNTKVNVKKTERKLLQIRNNLNTSPQVIQQDRYLEPIALSNKQKRKLLQNFDQKSQNRSRNNLHKRNQKDLAKKI